MTFFSLNIIYFTNPSSNYLEIRTAHSILYY